MELQLITKLIPIELQLSKMLQLTEPKDGRLQPPGLQPINNYPPGLQPQDYNPQDYNPPQDYNYNPPQDYKTKATTHQLF
jgi:hypothetical protein